MGPLLLSGQSSWVFITTGFQHYLTPASIKMNEGLVANHCLAVLDRTLVRSSICELGLRYDVAIAQMIQNEQGGDMPNVFLVDGEGGIVPMASAGFDSELDFQDLITACPDLLPGELIAPNDPRRWLLITPELGIPIQDGGSDHFSLDHLLLDQDGVPTFVEVKRAQDTRLRREVVAQMLDYAASAATYSSVEAMQAQMAKHYKTDEVGINERVAEFLGDSGAVDSFWLAVKTNLSAARMRLIFVADVIPSGLLRVIEFLNEHTDPLELLAVEIRQYQNEDGRRTLVPQVFGQTVEAQDRKSATPRQKRKWDESSFLAELRDNHGAGAARVAQRVIEWAIIRDLEVKFGSGRVDGSVTLYAHERGLRYPLMSIWTASEMYALFDYLADKPPFTEHAKRLALAERFNQIEGLNIPTDEATLSGKEPLLSYARVAEGDNIERLVSTLDWLVDEISKGD